MVVRIFHDMTAYNIVKCYKCRTKEHFKAKVVIHPTMHPWASSLRVPEGPWGSLRAGDEAGYTLGRPNVEDVEATNIKKKVTGEMTKLFTVWLNFHI